MSESKEKVGEVFVGVRFPARLAQELRARAKASDRSTAAEVRRAVREHLEKER